MNRNMKTLCLMALSFLVKDIAMKKSSISSLSFIIVFSFVLVLPNAYSQEDYLHFNKVITKLEEGKTVTGIWGFSQDLANARSIIEFNGFPTQEESINRPMIDFVMIAMEHYPYDIAKVRTFLAGLVSRREVLAKGNLQPSLATFVRLPVEGDDSVHAMIKQALDVGVHGIVIPQVSTPEQVAKIVKACRFNQPEDSLYKEPRGNRGYAPTICSYLWGLTREEYFARADVWPLNPRGDLMVIIMVESGEGVENIDEILKVPGLGAVFFGPSDYTVSIGKYGKTTDEIDATLYKVKNACNAAGIPFVGFADESNIARRIEDNFNMLIIGSDVDKTGSVAKALDQMNTMQ